MDSNDGCKAAIEEMQKCLKASAKEIEAINSGIRALYEPFKTFLDYQQQLYEKTRPVLEAFGNQFAEYSKKLSALKIPAIKFSNEFLRVLNDISYISILTKISWPLFLVDDNEVKDIVFRLCGQKNDNYPLDELASEITSFFTNEKIDEISMKWKDILSDDLDRYAVLTVAVKLHKEENYYGSTALLMCQLDGLIADVLQYVDEHDLKQDEELEKYLCESVDIKFKDHRDNLNKAKPSEKHMLIQLVAVPETGTFYWKAVNDYICRVVYLSKDEECAKYQNHNPLRNKICHGYQTNFGTEEISLKAIMTMDLILNLKSEIKWIETLKSKETSYEKSSID